MTYALVLSASHLGVDDWQATYSVYFITSYPVGSEPTGFSFSNRSRSFFLTAPTLFFFLACCYPSSCPDVVPLLPIAPLPFFLPSSQRSAFPVSPLALLCSFIFSFSRFPLFLFPI